MVIAVVDVTGAVDVDRETGTQTDLDRPTADESEAETTTEIPEGETIPAIEATFVAKALAKAPAKARPSLALEALVVLLWERMAELE